MQSEADRSFFGGGNVVMRIIDCLSIDTQQFFCF